jgi:superfamily II DNA or RNA helicase
VRWRERIQVAILEALRAGVLRDGLSQSDLDPRRDATGISVDQILIDCNQCSIRGDAVRLRAVATKSPTVLDAHSDTVRIECHPAVRNCDLLEGDALQLVIVDLTIGRGLSNNVHFSAQRQEGGLFSGQHLDRHEAGPSRPIPKVPRESLPEKGQTLEERLRWILTPPVHELLSDPSLGLPHTPYDYQVRGIGWLRGRDSALLADEMGLGKTMQAIIAARLLWREHEIKWILIVCPKTLIGTWRREIRQWWPNAGENVCEPTSGTRWFLKLATPNITIKIINYEKLARESDWLTKGERCGSHDLIIIDEAQRIKNPDSKSAKAVKALRGKRRWALTGTPLETKTGDVLSIFDFVHAGLLEGDEADYVRDKIRPFMLRRRVEDVLPDLPDKDDQDVEVGLTSRQRDAYDRAEADGVVALNEKGDTITVQHVFALIQKLIQLCNFDPPSGESAKLERLNEDIEEIIESGRKLLVFSQFVSEPFGLKRVKRELSPLCRVVEMHGQVPPRRREAAIDAFTNDRDVNTMLLHYRVGGLGLNLQAANYVYLFDRWWNPAVEDQAVKRAHRIGQQNKVIVRRLFCQGTIEDRILQKLAERRRLFTHVIESDDKPPDNAMGLTEEELFSLFKNLKARPKRARAPGSPLRVVLNNMNDKEFEDLVAKIYEAQGFEVQVVGGSHDGGVDIRAVRSNAPGRDRIVVQCKHIKGNVGRPDVQKLWGVANDDHKITRADLVASSGFTSEARQFARDKRLELVDRSRLVKLAMTLKVAEIE